MSASGKAVSPSERSPARQRVALVTGAGQRVGRVIALALARAGWRVGVHFHASAEGAQGTVAEIERAGGTARAFRADLADPAFAEPLVASVVEALGGLDALVNSAAGMERSPIGATTAAQFDAIVALNLRAPFLLSQAAARVMRAGSAIVHIADHMADEPWPDYAVHGVSKAGVAALTRHLASALAPGIRVNAVSPGFVLAPPGFPVAAAERFAADTPLQRLGTPEDVAGAVLYLLDAPFVTGEVLHVDGGRRVRR
ncbi:MAG: SDR family oxidoreductase [Gemmatimonadota bacterium]|nr:SDR family oxidoreductase [Gemmatimonadota bacterium]